MVSKTEPCVWHRRTVMSRDCPVDPKAFVRVRLASGLVSTASVQATSVDWKCVGADRVIAYLIDPKGKRKWVVLMIKNKIRLYIARWVIFAPILIVVGGSIYFALKFRGVIGG